VLENNRPGPSARINRSTSSQHLRQLVLFRNLAIAASVAAILLVNQCLMAPLALGPLISVTGLLALVNTLTACRLQQPWRVSELELLGQIVLDIGALALLLYFSGGAANPFVDLFLVPLTLAAARLPWPHAIGVALLTLACYTLLMFVHVPLPHVRPGAQRFLVLGMWVNYLFCAALIGYFVHTIAARLREQEGRASAAKQRDVDDEYLLRVGSLAASAAHEIRSPLCVMAVLVKELLGRRNDDSKDVTQNLRIMSDQIDLCRRVLSDLATHGQEVVNGGRLQRVDEFLTGVVDGWRITRPGLALQFAFSGTRPTPSICTDRGLCHALLNLLNNAADASPDAVEMDCTWDERQLTIRIADRGPGLPGELRDRLGAPFVSTKGDKGTGIGLLLSKAAIARAGGRLTLCNRPRGGACAEVLLPIGESHIQDARSPEGSAPPEWQNRYTLS
jgi:two-component system sensor histidine kinase RegB